MTGKTSRNKAELPADPHKAAASKRGLASRRRGAAAEREFAGMLSNELGQVVKRKLGQARDGGDDIQVGRYRIEVKRREKLAIEAWCKQVEAACTTAAHIGDDGQVHQDVPVVVFRRNGEPWRAVVPAWWFIQAMREDL